jgi:hypothetical protein
MSKNLYCLFYKYTTFFLFAQHLKQKIPPLLEMGLKFLYNNLLHHLLIGSIFSYRQPS